MKICSKCKQELLATTEYFSRQSTAKDGLHPWCKICMRAYRQSEKIRESSNQAGKKYRTTIRGHLRQVFTDMRKRCTNPARKDYKNYGGRGIRICFESFDEFFNYTTGVLKIDPRGLQIDRINNNGNYDCGNIQFITHKANQQNKRKSK